MRTVTWHNTRSIHLWVWIVFSILFGCENVDTSKSVIQNTVNDTAVSMDDSGLIEDTANSDDENSDTGTLDSGDESCDPVVYDPNPFVTNVIEVEFGEGAGFGQDQFPSIVYGPPLGAGPNSGSLDVVSLGMNGFIIVDFEQLIIDGEGPDLIVFENVFIGWYETGIVSASLDGETWFTWPCNAEDTVNGYPGCAGASPSLSHPDNCIDARDPELAGGDAFDLADIGLLEARYIRIVDSGASGPGGFDLDAISIVNGIPK